MFVLGLKQESQTSFYLFIQTKCYIWHNWLKLDVRKFVLSQSHNVLTVHSFLRIWDCSEMPCELVVFFCNLKIGGLGLSEMSSSVLRPCLMMFM